jgi:hypothetical protein
MASGCGSRRGSAGLGTSREGSPVVETRSASRKECRPRTAARERAAEDADSGAIAAQITPVGGEGVLGKSPLDAEVAQVLLEDPPVAGTQGILVTRGLPGAHRVRR